MQEEDPDQPEGKETRLEDTERVDTKAGDGGVGSDKLKLNSQIGISKPTIGKNKNIKCRE